MITEKQKHIYYKASLNKDSEYEGLFYLGVKTTGIFCRPTCFAKKPQFKNCEFFQTAQEALLAGYRPCKQCKPLLLPHQISPTLQKMIDAVEQNPEKRWKNTDFKALGVESVTLRRHFKKRFGMTFIAYARARRMGLALKQIKLGEPVIEAQLSSGYESGSGFRDAFSRILGSAPSKLGKATVLKAFWIDTELGPMLAVGDDSHLYLLEFVDRRGLEREIERMRKKLNAAIIPGKTAPIEKIEKEIKGYFAGTLKSFTTPLYLLGSPFQRKVWEELMKIPLGETRSYAAIAKSLGKPTAFRAVAQANGANQLCIIIPCHRVINSDGKIGGYGGGISRKEWLLQHERRL